MIFFFFFFLLLLLLLLLFLGGKEGLGGKVDEAAWELAVS